MPAVKKQWIAADLPAFTYFEIAKFLGEVPRPRLQTITWRTFAQIFELLWNSTDQTAELCDASPRRRWKNLLYIQGYNKARESLRRLMDDTTLDLEALLVDEVRNLFEYYCPCVPATSTGRWLAPPTSDKRPFWLSFIKSGTIHTGLLVRSEPRPFCSWFLFRFSLQWDMVFDMPATTIVRPGPERTEILRQWKTISFEGYGGRNFLVNVYRPRETLAQAAWIERNERRVNGWLDRMKTSGNCVPPVEFPSPSSQGTREQ